MKLEPSHFLLTPFEGPSWCWRTYSVVAYIDFHQQLHLASNFTPDLHVFSLSVIGLDWLISSNNTHFYRYNTHWLPVFSFTLHSTDMQEQICHLQPLDINFKHTPATPLPLVFLVFKPSKNQGESMLCYFFFEVDGICWLSKHLLTNFLICFHLVLFNHNIPLLQ